MPAEKCGGLEKDRDRRLFYYGEYEQWEPAIQQAGRSGGCYAGDEIFQKVVSATETVRRGEAVYEQDGVCFYKMLVNYQLITAFLYVYAKEKRLDVIDFGGALGSTWFRYRLLWQELDAGWTVVEQQRLAAYGKANITELNFADTLDQCPDNANVVLFSGVLSYLENPYGILEQVMDRKIPFIIIDEQAFHPEDKHSIMLQNVPPSIYRAVYPAHLFSLTQFCSFATERGYGIREWDYPFGNIPIRRDSRTWEDTVEKGFLLYRDDRGVIR